MIGLVACLKCGKSISNPLRDGAFAVCRSCAGVVREEVVGPVDELDIRLAIMICEAMLDGN